MRCSGPFDYQLQNPLTNSYTSITLCEYSILFGTIGGSESYRYSATQTRSQRAKHFTTVSARFPGGLTQYHPGPQSMLRTFLLCPRKCLRPLPRCQLPSSLNGNQRLEATVGKNHHSRSACHSRLPPPIGPCRAFDTPARPVVPTMGAGARRWQPWCLSSMQDTAMALLPKAGRQATAPTDV